MNKEKASRIKLLITDVDGVMTDGGMYFSSTGEEMKRFSARDGMAVGICREHNIEYGIISAGHSAALVEARAKVLKINLVYVGYTPKIEILKKWLKELNLSTEQVAYIGDDITDIKIMEVVGLSACPSDAAKKAKEAADIVLKNNGGNGCVREFVEEILLNDE